MSEKSSRIKTPRDARGIESLKILERTLNTVNHSRLPAKGATNTKHCHALNSQRIIKRVDRQKWESRIGEMHQLYERHRFERVNALYNALDRVKILLGKSRSREKQLRQTSGELERTSNYLHSLMDSMTDMLVATDRQGLVSEVNQAAAGLSGAEREELLQRHYSEIFADPSEADREINRTYQQEELYDLELDLRHSSGKTVPLLINTTVLKDETGQIVGLLITARDMSELKKAREEQERYASELARANNDLEEFASVASHDLQEPLKNVAKYAQDLSERFNDLFDEKALREIAFMIDQTAYMRELIKNVLDYAKVDSTEQYQEPVDCEQLYRRVEKNLAGALAESGVILSHEPLPVLHGNGAQLIRVFENIIGNAVKYHDPVKAESSIHVSAQPLDETQFGDKLPGSGWLFSFKDNGLGMDADFVDDVFKMFVRLHPEHAGSGMGLAIAEKIVRRHKGLLWVESVAGEGSTFYLALPK